MKRPVTTLSAGDYVRLQELARLLGEHIHPLASALLRKLDRASWREADDMPEQTVLLDGFVTYRVGGTGQPERRRLIDPADGMWPPAELSVITPLGITLLGLSVGDRIPMIGADIRAPPWVEVVAVDPVTTSGIVRGLTSSNAPAICSSLADHLRWPKNGRRLPGKGE
ncbi:transcription elongation factor [Bosea sp. BIWAKO-01]|uniref:transcription elongation factor n=1 Tax=Bosea sp. BIWAKO-01 TaxID=506668 RepID=UPI00114CB0E4|nr:transcription elongation factor [Bosea sp. BIWAKO-01]